jgi:hypothetical protein
MRFRETIDALTAVRQLNLDAKLTASLIGLLEPVARDPLSPDRRQNARKIARRKAHEPLTGPTTAIA